MFNHKATAFAEIAQDAQIGDICKTSTALDKIALTLLLWRNQCVSLSELEEKLFSVLELKQKTMELVKKLHELGVPVPVLKILWTEGNCVNRLFAIRAGL